MTHLRSDTQACVNPFHLAMVAPTIPRLNIVFNAAVDGLPLPPCIAPPDRPQ